MSACNAYDDPILDTIAMVTEIPSNFLYVSRILCQIMLYTHLRHF
jgi:hypothetical protein